MKTLSWIATGASNQEIAEILCITEKTVKHHVSNILSRLNLRDRTQATMSACSFLSLGTSGTSEQIHSNSQLSAVQSEVRSQESDS
jgi:hypothetical protein